MRAIGVLLVLILVAAMPLVPPGRADTFSVAASDLVWTPSFLEIAIGDSVSFTLAGGDHAWARDDNTDACQLPCSRTFPEPATVGYHCSIHPQMTGVIQVGPPLHVAITTPTAGQTVSGLVRVEGTASNEVDDIAGVSVRIGTRPAVAAVLSGGGPSVTWHADVDSLALADGAHPIVAVAQAGVQSAEARVGVVVNNPDRIDLQVFAVSAPSAATTSSSVTFAVRNLGNVPSGSFRLLAEYQYQGQWRTIGEVPLSSIAAGTSRTGLIAWDTGTSARLVGQFPIRATADPGALVADVDRSNNVRAGSAGWFTNAVPGIDLLDPL